MSDTNCNTTASQPSSAEKAREEPIKAVPALAWRSLLTIALLTSLVIRVVRNTASALWPCQAALWFVLAAVMALVAVACGPVALAVGRRSRLGNKG